MLFRSQGELSEMSAAAEIVDLHSLNPAWRLELTMVRTSY